MCDTGAVSGVSDRRLQGAWSPGVLPPSRQPVGRPQSVTDTSVACRIF